MKATFIGECLDISLPNSGHGITGEAFRSDGWYDPNSPEYDSWSFQPDPPAAEDAAYYVSRADLTRA